MPVGQVHGGFCGEMATKGLSLAARGLLLHLLELADHKGRLVADEPPLVDDVTLIGALYGGAQLLDNMEKRTQDRARIGLLFDELTMAGEVVRYSAGGRAYMLLPRVVTGGARGNKRAVRSTITPPPASVLGLLQLPAKAIAELADNEPWRDGESKEHAEKRAHDQDDVLDVFRYWLRVMGKDERRTRLDGPRRGCIKRALRLGYEAKDLKAAIAGCRADKWCMGENDWNKTFNDLTRILRDGEMIEKFRDQYLRARKGVTAASGESDAGGNVFDAAMREERGRRD